MYIYNLPCTCLLLSLLWFIWKYLYILTLFAKTALLQKLTERLSLSDLLVGSPKRAPEQMLTGCTSVWATVLAKNKRSGFMKATEGP